MGTTREIQGAISRKSIGWTEVSPTPISNLTDEVKYRQNQPSGAISWSFALEAFYAMSRGTKDSV